MTAETKTTRTDVLVDGANREGFVSFPVRFGSHIARKVMKRPFLSLLVISAIGCEGTDEIVSSRLPTPTPGPPYVIGGSVTDNGHPRRATVKAVSAGQTWSAVSSFSGRYRIGGLPAGEFQVTAAADYCGSHTETVTLPPSATVDLELLLCWRSPDPANEIQE